MPGPKVGIACMTPRGIAVLRRVMALRPEVELTVVSAREEGGEPGFFEALRAVTREYGGQFHEGRNLATLAQAGLLNPSALDLLLLVNWRWLVPASLYRQPRQGAFVFHDSLLPAYRGFSPTCWAIINGEATTGATLFAIADDVDAGDIIGQQQVAIGPDDTVMTVMGRVTEAYLRLLEMHLEELLAGTAAPRPQEHGKATYACKRTAEDNRIDWAAPTLVIHNLVRAVTHPYPGAFTSLEGRRLRVWSSRRDLEPRNYRGRIPGAVVGFGQAGEAAVLTGDGVLILDCVQLEDGPAVRPAEVFSSLGVRLGR
jgi:methionyl-tRNA formyltransferase